MLITLKREASGQDAEGVVRLLEGLGVSGQIESVGGRWYVLVPSGAGVSARETIATVGCVESAVSGPGAAVRMLRSAAAPRSVKVGDHLLGGGALTVVAGPCAVESEEQLLPVARLARQVGANLLRGGAFKPRSSPYDFQGLGEAGLRLLEQARAETGLPFVTEAVDERTFDLVEEVADVVQVGARNMQNFELLKRAGRSRRPVFLKRGLAAKLEDWLLAAEYVLAGGNDNVILCERGIRTFSDHSRFTLDLSVLPQLRRCSGLPVVVDPSHASGARESVAPMARAAVAAGADGVMLEVHPDPANARCDGPQSLRPTEFAALARELRVLEPLIVRQREAVS